MTDDPAPYDHLRPTDADVPDGIYRVVGTSDGLTLLRVGDADGRRVVTGEVLTVPDASGFETAEKPGSRPVSARLRSLGETLYWQLRAFLTSLAANPLASLGAVVLLLAGTLGPAFFDFSEAVGTGLLFAGALALAYVGSGRLDG